MLNPPERKQRLSGERVAEISLAACSMPADVPATSWLNDLCADLFDARAVIAARDEQLALAHGAYGLCLRTHIPVRVLGQKHRSASKVPRTGNSTAAHE